MARWTGLGYTLPAMQRSRSSIRRDAARRLIVGACGPLLLVGCKVGPDYEAPVTPSPKRWVATTESEGVVKVQLDASVAVDLSRWWARLGDSRLTSLVEEAIQSNLEMQLAEARLREAIALRRGALADLSPAIALEAGYTHRRAARNSSGDSDSGGGLSGSVSQSASSVSGLGAPSANLRYGDTSATIRLPEPDSGNTLPEINVTRSQSFGDDSGGFQRDRNAYEALLGGLRLFFKDFYVGLGNIR